MRAWMLCMAAGIGVVAWWPQLPSYRWLPLLIIPFVVLWRWRTTPTFRYALALVAGLCWGCGYGYWIRAGLLPLELEQAPLLLTGTIDGLVEQQPGFRRQPSQRFRFDVESCTIGAQPCAVDLHRVQLTWYEADRIPRAGERWQLRVVLKRPRGLANPGGFDYAAWLVANRIGATGYIERSLDNRRLATASKVSIDYWRDQAQQYLRERLAHASMRGLLLGLLIGDGSDITTRQWDTFRATGTVHLFVVSGLQIAFTGGLMFALAQLWWRSPLAVSRRRMYLLTMAPAWLTALGYALIAGFGLPLQRALIMFSVLLATMISRREFAASSSWILALWLTLLFDPLAVIDIGFWFSFIAVAAILLIVTGRRERISKPKRWGQTQAWRRTTERGQPMAWWQSTAGWPIKEWWNVQWGVFIASIPILLSLSGQLTLLALPANLIAIPWSTFVSMPLAFIALIADTIAPNIGAALWHWSDLSLVGLTQFLEMLQQRGAFGVWHARGFTSIGLVGAAMAAALMLLPRGTPGRGFAPLLLTPLLWPALPPIAVGDYRVTVIDVGQGLSVLIETAGHRGLYDTGPQLGAERSAADIAVLPLLNRKGIRTLDTVVVSHRDNDHAGGLPAITQRLDIQRLLVGDSIADGGREQLCRSGMQWHWDGVEFEILHPIDDRFRGNNRSCVLQIQGSGVTTLLPGDIERSAEFKLLDNPQLARADILLAPHHGSRSSSTETLLAQIQPRYVVFSSGYRNRFRHPDAGVEQRYREHGAELFNTASDGAVIFQIERGRVAQITRTRLQQRHYWD